MLFRSAPVPAPAPAPEPVLVSDAAIVEKLANAEQADKNRIVSVYEGLRTVMGRDKGENIKTTEKFSMLQAKTLNMAIDTPGKYPGLDEAIESVFAKALGTDAVVVVTPEVLANIVAACDTVINSAKK